MGMASSVAAAVQTSDSANPPINHYPAAKYWGNQLHYPLDEDLSGGQRYPAFEQPRSENGCGNSLFACSRINTPARVQTPLPPLQVPRHLSLAASPSQQTWPRVQSTGSGSKSNIFYERKSLIVNLRDASAASMCDWSRSCRTLGC